MKRLKGSNQFKAKYSRRSRVQVRKAIRNLKLYTALLILVSLLAYIMARGMMDIIVDLINMKAEAPTYKVYAQEKTPTMQEINNWETFKKRAAELAPIYDFPVKVILSQAGLESAHGTSKFAHERNNYFGFRCYDTDPDKYCAYFDNMDQSIIEYMQLIKDNYQDAYKARSNPDKMIELIREGGYATDPSYVSKVMSMPEWRNN